MYCQNLKSNHDRNTVLVMFDSDSEEDNSVFAHPLIEDIYEKCVTIEPSEHYLTKMTQLDAIKYEPNSEYVVPAEISSQPISSSETSNDDHSDTEEDLINRPIIDLKPNFSFRKSILENTIVSPALQIEGQIQRSNFKQPNSVNTYTPQFVRPIYSEQVSYYGRYPQTLNSVSPSYFIRPLNMGMSYSFPYHHNPVYPNHVVRHIPVFIPPLSRPYCNQSNFINTVTPVPQFVRQFNPRHGVPYYNNISYPPNPNLVRPFPFGAVGMPYNYPQNQMLKYNSVGHYPHYTQNHIYNTIEDIARQILNVCDGPFADVPNFKNEVTTTAVPILGDPSISFANPVNNIDWIFAENYNINEILKENPKSKRLYERQYDKLEPDSTDISSLLSRNNVCDNKDTNVDVNNENEESELYSLKEDTEFTANVLEKYETISNITNQATVDNIELGIRNLNNRRSKRCCCGFPTSLNHFPNYRFIAFLFAFLGIFLTVALWII